MKAKDVLELCENNGIDRIVIDSKMPTMFVLERNKGNIQTEIIQENTKVIVGKPLKPIPPEILKKLQQSFSQVPNIKEVYQFNMVRNKESSLIFGFVLENYNEKSRTACIDAVRTAMVGQPLDAPLDIMMLEDQSWLPTIKGIKNALICKNNS